VGRLADARRGPIFGPSVGCAHGVRVHLRRVRPRARAGHNGIDYFKPHQWFQRRDQDGIQDACSRECIEKNAGKTGKSVVLPF